MTRTRDIARRVRGKYLKPELPDGPFVIVDRHGNASGVRFPEDLKPSGLPGEPWGFFDGSPRIYRVRSQKDGAMKCEDGTYRIVPAPEMNLERL